MSTEATRKRFNVDEYHRMAEVGVLGPDERTELIDGEVFQMTAIGGRHAWCLIRMVRVLGAALMDRAIVSPQIPLGLGDYTEPVPDLALLRMRDEVSGSRLPSASDAVLVVEISDATAALDLNVKRPRYAAAGIPELWIADLEAGGLRVWRAPAGHEYTAGLVLGPDDHVSVEAFPDRVFRVGELLC